MRSLVPIPVSLAGSMPSKMEPGKPIIGQGFNNRSGAQRKVFCAKIEQPARTLTIACIMR
jgi:hypothetical protein